MRLLRVLDKHPQVHHRAYRAVNAWERRIAAAGLDLNKLRVSVAEPPPHPSLTVIPYREAELVAVASPSASFDLEPSRFSSLCAHLASSGYSRPADAVITVENGRFGLPSGFVVVGRRLLSDVIPLLYFPHPENLLPSMRVLTNKAEPAPDGILACLPMSASYYHWLCEILPRALIVADRAGPELPLYVSAEMPGFVSDSLTMLGLGQRIHPMPAAVYTAKRFHVSTFERAEWPVPSDVWAIRSGLLEAVGVTPRPRGRRLLISRADAIGRRLLNESQIAHEFGLEVVTLSQLTLAEQIRLFAEAELVVAPHGAGLTNIMFAPSSCRVVELTVDSHISPSYVIIASLMQQPYGYVSGYQRARDMHIDVSGLKAVLKHLG